MASNAPMSQLKVLLSFVFIGIVLIVAGTYTWTPLIFIGIILILLGYFLADF